MSSANMRKEIRRCGSARESPAATFSDRSQLRKLVEDSPDRFERINPLIDDATLKPDLLVPRLTDEEWLAQ